MPYVVSFRGTSSPGPPYTLTRGDPVPRSVRVARSLPLARVVYASIASIHFDIFPGRNVPGEVRLRGVALDVLPAARVAERRDRPLDGIDERFSLVLPELEPRPPVGELVGVDHRVFQPAGGADDRDVGVTQAVHLLEPARLVPRRHQEHVRPAFDEMRQALVEADARRRPLRPARRPGASTARRS